MLNPFPSLLVFGFFAPTLLRIAAACMMAYIAYMHIINKNEISKTRFPIIGAGAWVVWVSVIVEVLVGASLLFGYGTQYAAILLGLIALKYIVWAGKYPKYFIYSRSTAILLCVIAVSLLLSGAGAFAMDLPL
jgi:uncharacterized membrane protein YphA (DoxX/SURF4 family)